MTAQTDFLAVFLIGGGSSYGRAPEKEKAIDNCVRSIKDWDCLFDVSDKEVTINVVDVSGYSDCSWGDYHDHWLHGKNEATGKSEPIRRDVEKVKRRTPKWRRRR